MATFIAADNKQGGVLIGRSIVAYCKGKDPCKLGVVEGNLADQSGRDENTGMRSVVDKAKNIKIVGHQPTDYDPAKALNVATNLLTANPDLNYIYSWWDQGALASLQAAKAKNLAGKIGIAGFGGNCLNLAEVIKGNIYQETVFFPQSMGALIVRRRSKAIKGTKLPRDDTGADHGGDDEVRERAPLRQGQATGQASDPAKLKQAKSGKCPK